MHPDLERLQRRLRGGPAGRAKGRADARTRARVDEFLDRHDFPLQEGRRYTFVYRGGADAVRLRHWIFGLPTSQPFHRLEGASDLWWLDLELPRSSRIEYKLEVDRDGATEWIQDPLNPRQARDPFGANSVLYGEGYLRPSWTRPDPHAARGDVSAMTVESRAFGEPRELLVYRPARRRYTGRYPLLVVHDGRDYLQYADLGTVLDNLIERMEIPPLVVALTQTGDRMEEYADDPRHARFVAEEIPTCLEAELPLEPDPAHRGLMGASFGAVASLSAAWRHPGRFGRLLLQSGSFAFTDIGEHSRDEVFDPVVEFMSRFRRAPGKPAAKVFVSCGVFESLIYENRSLVPRLQETGMEVRYREARDGHNWENWRDRLREGLSWLFPGPLWLVYE